MGRRQNQSDGGSANDHVVSSICTMLIDYTSRGKLALKLFVEA